MARITKDIKNRIEKGLDVRIEKGGKEYFFFKDNEEWTRDIIVDGEVVETDFFDDEDVLYEIKNI